MLVNNVVPIFHHYNLFPVMKYLMMMGGCLATLLLYGQPTTVQVQHGSVRYETPLPYEAMHIALALTDTSIYSGQMNVHFELLDTSSAYYREVQQTFGAYRQHPLVKALNEALHKDLLRYVQNLKLAYNSQWVQHQLEEANVYPFPMRLLYQSGSVGRRLLEDFINAAGIPAFFETHRTLYEQGLQQVKNFANIAGQQAWLEQQFDSRYQQYFIIVSPLMGSTHFTNRFRIDEKESCLMYVADAKAYSTQADVSEQARYLGIVMTEIDHNYVNPESDRYEKQLNNLMGGEQRSKWIKPDGVGQFYGSGYKIFNEYMTHAVYLLYTSTYLNATDQASVVATRTRIMEVGRGYYRFGAFYEALRQQWLQVPARRIKELYPAMLQWCQGQQ